MEVVIYYEALKDHNETIIKKLPLVADGIIRTLHFEAPYDMRPNGSTENGLNWDDHIPYHQLQKTVNEDLAGYALLY